MLASMVKQDKKPKKSAADDKNERVIADNRKARRIMNRVRHLSIGAAPRATDRPPNATWS
jgi:hypothetical protein